LTDRAACPLVEGSTGPQYQPRCTCDRAVACVRVIPTTTHHHTCQEASHQVQKKRQKNEKENLKKKNQKQHVDFIKIIIIINNIKKNQIMTLHLHIKP
jgi:hypothetical protein